MSDMLVKLYDVEDCPEVEAALKAEGIHIVKALSPDKHRVIPFIKTFSEGWGSECEAAFANNPHTIYIAVKDKKVIGFAAYDATARGFFGPTGVDPEYSIYYNPAHVKNLEAVKELTKEGLAMSDAHKVMPTRLQTIHWRLMRYHAMWCVLIADAMIEKCQGHDKEAIAKWKESVDHFSQYDVILDPWFDMSQASVSYRWIMRASKSTHDI